MTDEQERQSREQEEAASDHDEVSGGDEVAEAVGDGDGEEAEGEAVGAEDK